MATSFSRTTRSLQADKNYSTIGLWVAIALAMMWAHWFLTAKITFYEVSQALYVTDDEIIRHQFSQGPGAKRIQAIRKRIVIAEFPPKIIENIQPGQKAYIQFDKRPDLISATVTKVNTNPTKGTVELRAEIDATVSNPFETGEGGQVKIEVKNVTPAILVLNASGLLTETHSLSASPQRWN